MCIEPYTNPQDLSKKKLGYAFCLEFQEEDRSRIDHFQQKFTIHHFQQKNFSET